MRPFDRAISGHGGRDVTSIKGVTMDVDRITVPDRSGDQLGDARGESGKVRVKFPLLRATMD